MDKDNKSGFSGLSGLTSSEDRDPTFQPRQTTSQSPVPENSRFSLLELTKWPNLPAPWSSVDSGETWVWGDFFLIFQKKPKSRLDSTMGARAKKAGYQGRIDHYAM